MNYNFIKSNEPSNYPTIHLYVHLCIWSAYSIYYSSSEMKSYSCSFKNSEQKIDMFHLGKEMILHFYFKLKRAKINKILKQIKYEMIGQFINLIANASKTSFCLLKY